VANLFVHKSAIHGKGLFTKVQIKKGTKMCVVADLNKYSNGENIMTDLGSLINHSKKNANCEFFEDNDSVGFVFFETDSRYRKRRGINNKLQYLAVSV